MSQWWRPESGAMKGKSEGGWMGKTEVEGEERLVWWKGEEVGKGSNTTTL